MGRPRKPNTLGEQASLMYTLHHAHPTNLPPWRNRLARSAVNRKVGGSSPPRGELFGCKRKGHSISQCNHTDEKN